MEDGALMHNGHASAWWRAQIGLKKLQWPTNSPDLNPLEKVWKVCKDQVQHMTQPRSKEEMWHYMHTTWEGILQETLHSLVLSMSKQLEIVVEAQGSNTWW
jgi:hypothetical protein